MSHFPVALKKVSQSELGIRWDDQKETSLTVRKLRLECPCASCIDEWTREKLLKDEQVPQDVHPIRMHTVGRYALRVEWSDGHNTGIYPFKSLRKLCES